MKKYKITIMLTILLISLLNTSIIFASTAEEELLRVGLKSLYENVDIINVKNTSLIAKYPSKEGLKEAFTLSSETGFTFEPTKKSYWISDQSFTTMEEAEKKIKQIQNKNIHTYISFISLDCYKIYIEFIQDDNISISELYNQNNLSFKKVDDNGLRILMKTDKTTIIIENEEEHLVFSTNQKSNGINIIDLGSRKYRGSIEIGRYKKDGITAINIIPIEEYLYGVVPSEMPASWNVEALKAQAVVARTYAKYYKKIASNNKNKIYDLCDTNYSQVYYGILKEHENSNKAIDLTKGKKVYYNNNIIPTYFFASSGGRTEDSENVWKEKVPYLRSVPDLYEQEPTKEPWTVIFTSKQIYTLLEKKGVNIGEIKDIIIQEYTDALRVLSLKIVGTKSEYILTKESIRSLFGLYSRKFKIIKNNSKNSIPVISNSGLKSIETTGELHVINGKNKIIKDFDKKTQFISIKENNYDSIPIIQAKKDEFIFVGQGYGHGVGLSQCGAKGMALKGFNYKQIVEHYFKGTTVK